MAVYRYPSVGLIDVCFTIGATEIYDKYIAEARPAYKDVGGTVWKSMEEAAAHLRSIERTVTLVDDGTRVPASVYSVGLPSDFEKCTKLAHPFSFFSLTCPGVLMGRCDV